MEAAPKVFREHLGRTDQVGEHKLAELYEQVGRVMVERDFLLRRSALYRASGRLAMVERHRPVSLRRQCVLLGLSRAALYYRPVEVGAYQLELMALIDRQYLRSPFYGSRRMTVWLRDAGAHGQSQAGQALDAADGTGGDLPAPAHQPARARTSDLLRICCAGLAIERINQVWAADICYIPMARGFLYLVAVMDWVSRYVLAWRLSNLLETSFCVARSGRSVEHRAVPRSSTPTRAASSLTSDFTGVLACARDRHQHGRARPLQRQHLRRAALAQSQVRGGLSEEPTRAWRRRARASPPTSSSTTTSACTRR